MYLGKKNRPIWAYAIRFFETHDFFPRSFDFRQNSRLFSVLHLGNSH